MRTVSLQPNRRSDGCLAAAAAIRPLSRLPVFLDLGGKRAVVIGGSDAAAWKAELLAMSGGVVDVFCGRIGERMEALLGRDLAAGAVRHAGSAWSEATLAGASLVVADGSVEAEAKAVHEAAKRLGVPLNVIDRPAFCDFQFGAIVNRSPVVIGISTSGAAPVLGQAIRGRIETLLPAGLAGWGGLALKLRESVAEKLKPGAERRRFWEEFVRRCFSGEPDEAADARALAEIGRTAGADAAAGRVTIVGAGPGDPELLTLKAIRALQAADVVLFEEPCPAEVLELARREARRICVGSRPERPGCCQHHLNATMIALARDGRHVVCLEARRSDEACPRRRGSFGAGGTRHRGRGRSRCLVRGADSACCRPAG